MSPQLPALLRVFEAEAACAPGPGAAAASLHGWQVLGYREVGTAPHTAPPSGLHRA